MASTSEDDNTQLNSQQRERYLNSLKFFYDRKVRSFQFGLQMF